MAYGIFFSGLMLLIKIFCTSIAKLDENNNGFILNSVHSTEGCYSYTKEINAGVSSLTLGKEEEEALRIAMKAE